MYANCKIYSAILYGTLDFFPNTAIEDQPKPAYMDGYDYEWLPLSSSSDPSFVVLSCSV